MFGVLALTKQGIFHYPCLQCWKIYSRRVGAPASLLCAFAFPSLSLNTKGKAAQKMSPHRLAQADFLVTILQLSFPYKALLAWGMFNI